MTIDINNYTNALTNFYKAAAEWKFACNTNNEKNTEFLKELKKKALLLREELKHLPIDMQRPMVLEHIEKALNIKES